MATPILATKLYVPPPGPKVVVRPRLIERLNEGRRPGVTLISAAAGFGKTTLVSEWLAAREREDPSTRAAWLSLDEGDNDPARFLTYLIAALQTIAPHIGATLMGVLLSPQPPPIELILTTLVNEISALPDPFILVLDDYHVIESEPVDQVLTFLLEHLPPQLHLVIATREDPQPPLARLRARGQLTEMRASDLRFTSDEAAEFLNRVMGLNLTPADVAALENRTEGWIAGLQLAALSMKGHHDSAGFIQSFTGSHHFVLDYLLQEVLQQQPERIQTFLLRTSFLDRLCGPLCDAVLPDSTASGQETLEYIERANLFIIPLDNERRWYRYHHLFGDLLRQRLQQSLASPAGDGDAAQRVNELHIRASQWFEDNGLDIEAFRHAAAANDIDRAERLIEGRGIPLHLRGAVTAIIDWLGSLPAELKDARPSLWWRHGAMMLVVGQTTGVEEKLDAAEAGLQRSPPDDQNRLLIGRIAAARAVLALTRYQVDKMIAESLRALEHFDPKHLSLRANANWTLGYAYVFLKDWAPARRALTEAIALGQASGDIFTTLLSSIGLANVQEAENQLTLAAETYRRLLQMAGDQPLQIIYEVHLGLARVLYEWNDLQTAEHHARQSLHLAQQYDRVIDRYIVCEVFLARVKLAQGDIEGATGTLARASQSAHQKNFVYRLPEVAAGQVAVLLRQGHVPAAAQLAGAYDLPLSQARVSLPQGDPDAALGVLDRTRQFVEAKGWQDERLRVMVLQALTYQALTQVDTALQILGEALAVAEPGGFIRLFVDEGPAMAQLLAEAASRGMAPGYTAKLLAAFEAEPQPAATGAPAGPASAAQGLIEPLSQRELEVLGLIAQGLSNQEISQRLFLALDTVKGHNRRIFDKLGVQRRTEAVAHARKLGLL